MTGEVVERVLRSRRYRDVDPSLIGRLADEEMVRSRTTDEAVKRVKRRLHQAVGAFRDGNDRDPMASLRRAWDGRLDSETFRTACAEVMATHSSTRERLDDLPGFFGPIWEAAGGIPRRLLDIGCGLGPLALPWMGLGADAAYHAVDADRGPLGTVDAFLALAGQPHRCEAVDVVAHPPSAAADVALALKLVTTLDRQDPAAAGRLVGALDVRHAVVSFARRSLGGHGRGMERTYRDRVEQLAESEPRIRGLTDVSVPTELVFVLELAPIGGTDG